MKSELQVDVQFSLPDLKSTAPASEEMIFWAQQTYAEVGKGTAELSVMIADKSQGEALNKQYRGKEGATNVLSFPAETVLPNGLVVLGDVVICAPVVIKEAQAMGVRCEAHWMHMIVHGVLHLMGYDHIKEEQARCMEALETRILLTLGVSDPYAMASTE